MLEYRQALQRRAEVAAKTKVDLSGVPKAGISMPLVTADVTGPEHIVETVSSNKFEPTAAALMRPLCLCWCECIGCCFCFC